jgi:hypothetical protein
MTTNQELHIKSKDKLREIRFNCPDVLIELEMFRGLITPVNIPKGVVVRLYDYDVLELGGDDQLLRKGKHNTKASACMVKDMKGPSM